MMQLSLWLKENNFRVDQVQIFIRHQWLLRLLCFLRANPLNPLNVMLKRLFLAPKAKSSAPSIKPFFATMIGKLAMLRKALRRMGRADLIGPSDSCLVPGESRREKGCNAVNRESQSTRRNPEAWLINDVARDELARI